MKKKQALPAYDPDPLPSMPSWVTAGKCDSPEAASFASGAALCSLHLALRHDDVPQALLRDRLALRATEACMTMLGRPERAPQLRDEVHLIRPGDQPGPAGAIYQQWRRAVAGKMSDASLQKVMPELRLQDLALWLGPDRDSDPMGRASGVLQAVLASHPRAEHLALILADVALAQSAGWSHAMPLLAIGLRSRDLHKTDAKLTLACHKALVMSAKEALRQATLLTRKASRLRAITPRLRAKPAAQAVQIFLSRDALTPSLALNGLMTNRSGRRLCDRLVELGAIQELTGRSTFRLYGL